MIYWMQIGVVRVYWGDLDYGPLLNVGDLTIATRRTELPGATNFTPLPLLIVVGKSLCLMELVWAEPCNWDFLAGGNPCNSPYKHALESDLDPFQRAFYFGLIFYAVGSTIKFQPDFEYVYFICRATIFDHHIKSRECILAIGKFKNEYRGKSHFLRLGYRKSVNFLFVHLCICAQLEFWIRAIRLPNGITALSNEPITPNFLNGFDG